MAENARQVRIEEQLKIKIGEAKNLCSRSAANTSCSTQGTRDVYCTVALDQEEICRTPTIERTLSPFFGEEYHFKIPRRFRYLSVYVWDRDRHLKQDKAIGKIAIKREELHLYNHRDHWFSLRPVDSDSEVQGMVHLEVRFEEVINQLNEQKITLFRSAMVDYEHDMMGAASQINNQHQTNQNEYKENSELSNIQEASKNYVGLSANKRNTSENPTSWKSRLGGKIGRVSVRVHECIDLPKKNGVCDPYIVFTAFYSNKRQISKRTKVRKKTVNPEFNEIVHFDLCIETECSSSSKGSDAIFPYINANICEIVITVWHDSSGMADKVFLGEIKIPMRNKQQQTAVQQSAWYFLQPRSSSRSLVTMARSCATPPGTRLSCDNTIGSLRLKILYTADHVFPLATYDSLMNLLLQSVNKRPVTVSAVYILGEIVSCKTDLSQPLVRLFTHAGCIAPVIKALADHEISNLTDCTTIFRGNTLVSKMMDETMRLFGLHYLHQTLRPALAQILTEKKPCEIDPSKVKDKSAVDTNIRHLQDYVELVFRAITHSATRCPKILCQIFHDLRECAGRYFPRNNEVRYSVVSGFIFLRFFAPAILGPKLFNLTTEPLDSQTNRTLTLISKTIQSLGNLVSSRSSQQPCKEQYTGQLYKKFCTEKHMEAVKHFLEMVSSPSSEKAHILGNNNASLSNNMLMEPLLLKEGMMIKHPQCRKRFGRHPFKQRYFRLTTHSLSYAKAKGKQPICDIPLLEIERIEQLSEKSFKMQYCFKIVRKDRSLIVQTTNCVEEREWIDILHKICYTNSMRSQCFHSSAFVNGVYSCCSRSDENAPGCRSISSESVHIFQLGLANALDPALDLQRIHTLIMSHMSQLKVCIDPAFRHLQTHNTLWPTALVLQQQSSASYQDFLAAIKQLFKVAYDIDKDHRDYKQGISRELKYGSREVPIGEDNYYHMIRAVDHLNIEHRTLQLQKYQYSQKYDQQLELAPNYSHHHDQNRSQQDQQFEKLIQEKQPSSFLPEMEHVMAYPYYPQVHPPGLLHL